MTAKKNSGRSKGTVGSARANHEMATRRKSSDPEDLHERSMSLCDQALAAQRKGKNDLARELFLQAFELRRNAAALVANSHDFEPTRSVLHRSAASLALQCGERRAAEKLIATALSGEPPAEIADELRDLLEQVNLERHLELRGLELTPSEFQIVIEGNATGYGMAKTDEFVDRVQTSEKLIIRTIERMSAGQTFREAGKAIKAISKNFELYLSAPRAAGFCP